MCRRRLCGCAGSRRVICGERGLRPRVLEALDDTRVVVVLGARQVGKSTLVQDVATRDRPATILTLDDQATRDAAAADPAGFLAGLVTPVVIDEVQRVPDLLLAIKVRVDRDPAPGQFLLTGSANILTAPRIADALTGRAEYLRLAPFSQGELRSATESFVPLLFDGRWPQITSRNVGRAAYAEIVATGGYPAVMNRTGARRARFFDSYVDTIIQRDLRTIAQVHDQANGAIAGMAFETFAAIELRRQVASQDNAPRQFHYRDRDGREVDVVLERRDGSVVAVEVKTAASASPSDFRGLRHLRDKLGERFKGACCSTPASRRCRSVIDSRPSRSVVCGQARLDAPGADPDAPAGSAARQPPRVRRRPRNTDTRRTSSRWVMFLTREVRPAGDNPSVTQVLRRRCRRGPHAPAPTWPVGRAPRRRP